MKEIEQKDKEFIDLKRNIKLTKQQEMESEQ